MLFQTFLVSLLLVPLNAWEDKKQCMDYIQNLGYHCTKRHHIYNGTNTKVYEVNKGGETFMMKVTKLDMHAYNELSVLLRLKETKYVPELFAHKTTDTAMVLVLTNGNYSNLLVAMKEKSEFQDMTFILKFFAKIVEGVDLIHKAKYSHNDLRPENILVTKSLDPLIIDFDITVPLDTNAKGQGYPIFISPENLLAIENEELVFYDEKTDIFSLGALLYLMVIGDTPVRSAPKYENYLSAEIVFPKTIPLIISEIIQGCYTIKENRINMVTLKKKIEKALSPRALSIPGVEYRYKMDSLKKFGEDFFFLKYKNLIFIFLAFLVLGGISFAVFKNWDKLNKIDVGVEIKEKKKKDIETPMDE